MTSQEDRPGVGSEATRVHGQANTSIVPVPDRLRALLQGVYVVVVEVPEDRVRRRVFLSLNAAQRVADRAQERGHEASVVLCQLQALGVVE